MWYSRLWLASIGNITPNVRLHPTKRRGRGLRGIPMNVEVRSVLHRNGNKNGKDWAMDVATVIVANADGTEAVGEVILPKNHPKVTKGLYKATLKARQMKGAVSFEIESLQSTK